MQISPFSVNPIQHCNPTKLYQPLDGNTYRRTVPHAFYKDLMVEHSVTFNNGKMIDSANTAFGNPPESHTYKVTGKQVWILTSAAWKKSYVIENDQLVRGHMKLDKMNILGVPLDAVASSSDTAEGPKTPSVDHQALRI